MIELRGAEVHERRDEQHVGSLGGDERFDRPRARNAALEESQQPIESGRPAEPRAGTRLDQTHDDARRPIVHPPSQVHGRRVARVEEAKIVEAETDPPRQLRPRAGAPARHIGEPHVRMARGDALDHLTAAHRFLAIGSERDRVAARGQPLDRRLEEPQIRVVPRDEQNLQGVTPRPAAGSRSRYSPGPQPPAHPPDSSGPPLDDTRQQPADQLNPVATPSRRKKAFVPVGSQRISR